MRLCTDILLHIVELICKEDVGTLKALALTLPILREPCQEQLFESIDLQLDIQGQDPSALPPTSLVQFHDIITKTPRIALYVREVRITQHSIAPSAAFRYCSPEPITEIVDRLALINLISDVFDALSLNPIHTLSFVSWEAVRWTDLDQRVQRSLLGILKNPAFRKISLRGLHIPLHFFGEFTSLQSVNLYFPGFCLESSKPITLIHQISELTYHVSSGLVGATHDRVGPNIGLDLSSLQYLELRMKSWQIPYLSHYFRLPKLRRLRVSTFPFFPGVHSINFSGLPELTHLTLHNLSFSPQFDEFEWMRNAFGSLTKGQLQMIESVTIALTATLDSIDDSATLDLMTKLGRHLSLLHRSLEKVKSILVHVKICSDDQDAVLLSRDRILRCLAWNGSEGVLEIKFEGTDERPRHWILQKIS
ncbi:hypothetical protein BDN72DRAFT_961023 [Pluteus cervinus]|uniref:Uncharacterized protein n=1 Tax=Pluteus cervinus TaxID=181527 RepID=A0ACD3ANZ5_9AGAR|nr:hypothetical protein BDN72DRAFT_961023 [Pluteus cervinus]